MGPDRVLTRRSILAGAANMGAANAFGAAAQVTQSSLKLRAPVIDVHHHFLPAFYTERVAAWLQSTNASGSDAIMKWSAAKDTAELDRAGIETAILSISSPGFDSPGFDFGTGRQMISLARRCNEFASDLSKSSKGRYLFFTALPMPDVDASLQETAHGYDALGATGVGLMTNYRGLYLGDKTFTRLFENLNDRAAIVFVHPTDAPCCRGLIADVPTPSTEFAVDTGRTITSLLWSGTLSRFPRIRFVFSHGGGILPTIHSRITAGMERLHPELKDRVPGGAVQALSKIFVDTASIANNPAFEALTAWARPTQILFGSDYPWLVPASSVSALAELVTDPATLSMIYRENARTLMDHRG